MMKFSFRRLRRTVLNDLLDILQKIRLHGRGRRHLGTDVSPAGLNSMFSITQPGCHPRYVLMFNLYVGEQQNRQLDDFPVCIISR